MRAVRRGTASERGALTNDRAGMGERADGCCTAGIGGAGWVRSCGLQGAGTERFGRGKARGENEPRRARRTVAPDGRRKQAGPPCGRRGTRPACICTPRGGSGPCPAAPRPRTHPVCIATAISVWPDWRVCSLTKEFLCLSPLPYLKV